MPNHVIAFDTANEVISVGVGALDREKRSMQVCATVEVPAFRASNVKLISCLQDALDQAGVFLSDIACVVCGRGPGSFTGVRICMAAAKGIALGLDVPLYGVSTADAQAQQFRMRGGEGTLVVLGDAMRKEVYPVRYAVSQAGVQRLNPDVVIKAADAPAWVGEERCTLTGDGLRKHVQLFSEGVDAGRIRLAPEETWTPTGAGLLAAAQALWREGLLDPDDKAMGNALAALPVYTRLSDAEEAERRRFASPAENKPAPGTVVDGPACTDPSLQAPDLSRGVQGAAPGEHADVPLRYQPLDAAWVGAVAALESRVMGSDAWNAAQVADELPRPDRTWWAAFAMDDARKRTVEPGSAQLVGYAGGWVVDGQLQVLKVATEPGWRRKGVAQELIGCLARDARDLGASECTLEVRSSNVGAHAFYERLGLRCVGTRPGYYSDREDARIYTGPLPLAAHDVAGMELHVDEVAVSEPSAATDSVPARPSELIVAFETSCDETAAAIVDGQGNIVADVVASQIDFHSRFGGVVPEIASRKHIEAIAGVACELLLRARANLSWPSLSWSDLSAVSVTYAPGLVGALVVGVAFAKGLAWATGKPLVRVNHLEGHLYANKIATPDIQPPMVVSLVSGGHTMLVHVKDWGEYETLGSTLDDAVGEAFDKVAKAMGLGYPGGPLISTLAEKGNLAAIDFPRALLHSGDLRFSLSGLKTAVSTYLQKERAAGRKINEADVAASFEAAVIDVQIAKAQAALRQTGAKEFCLGGGVAANPHLRQAYEKLCDKLGVRLTMPPLSACTDNASMIALAALDRYRKGKLADFSCDVSAHAPLDQEY